MNKRIIFSLLYSNGFFFLSRNFRLQKVGNIDWINSNYGFDKTCHAIDELIITLVTKNPDKDEFKNYFSDVEKLRKKIFVPLTLGGGIKTVKDAKECFLNGADKILVNTMVYDNPELLEKISEFYGDQANSVMIDFKKEDAEGSFYAYKKCGQVKEKKIDKKFIYFLNNLKCGDIIFNSIDNDGNAGGINLDICKIFNSDINKPVLMMGGAGKPEHIYKTLMEKKVSGVVTANLFNFLGDGLQKARDAAIEKKIRLPNFEKTLFI